MRRILHPAALAVALSLLPSCARERLGSPDSAPPAAVFQGPRELRGTIGSFARLQGGDPLLVSGYGLVVNLENTGSAVVPEFLRGWLGNEMRKRGVGSGELAARNPELAAVTPERLMLSQQTAVVRVSGLIPPGATPGTPFDLLLEALPEDTDTTSLAGGQLWQSGLGVGGANRRLAFTTPLSVGAGPVYLAPTAEAEEAAVVAASASAGVGAPAATAASTGSRRAVVVGGGHAIQPRRLELVLHQPSWANARRIADTINERYRAGASSRPGATPPTANAVSDALIQINVPERFAARPGALLDLIGNTYPYPVDRADTVRSMMALLAADEPSAEVLRRAPLVCRALGPNAVEPLRAFYDDPNPRVRGAALDTGAWLTDDDAVPGLLAVAGDPSSATRAAAAVSLSLLSRNLRATEGLRRLLDDDEPEVRLAAYEAAAASGNQLVERTPVEDLDGVKFLIDRVPSERPWVLAIPRDTPRLVIFGAQTGFSPPVFDADPAGSLLIRTATGFGQALQGLRTGDTAFLPAVARTQIRETTAEAVDARGDIVSLELAGAADAFRDALPLAMGVDGGRPVTLRCRVVDAERQTLELLGVEPGLTAMPLSVFYRPTGPGDDNEARTERVSPTVAALAWFLAHRPTMSSPQEGLNLSFGRTVNVLDRLARADALPAPMRLLDNPLAADIAAAEAEEAAARGGRSLTAEGAPPSAGRQDTAR